VGAATLDVGAIYNLNEWVKTLDHDLPTAPYLAALQQRNKSRTRASRTVFYALAGNTAVLSGKFVAYLMTGSGALLAESLHSVADCLNQVLLVVGLHRSGKAASREHPYGHATEVYVWAIISATGAFFLGSGVCVYHGVEMLLHPAGVDRLEIALGVLGLSFVAEAATLSVAVRSVRESARELGVPMLEYLRGSNDDPLSVSVLIEDAASVTGIVIAAASVLATAVTGNTTWDAIGTLAVGGLLGIAATWLIRTNMKALIGRSMPAHREAAVIMALRNDPVVRSVHDVKTVVNGPGTAKFKAEILFDGLEIGRRTAERHRDRWPAIYASIRDESLTEEEVAHILAEYGDLTTDVMGNEIDRLELLIRGVAPEIVYVDLEAL
jgi:zinc transporter 9